MNKATRKQARKQAEQRGRRAETLAAWLLRLKGYKILDMRKQTPHGEIDIIALKGKVLAIVEVKRRPTLDKAQDALHNANLSRIEEAAYYYHDKRTRLGNKDIRFDAVYVMPGLRIKHVKDAWRGY
ncbi:MAG: YraN family protein [Robiginitomaculum sp.]|nr:YraN family protein [Robiginitomaculum sp.]